MKDYTIIQDIFFSLTAKQKKINKIKSEPGKALEKDENNNELLGNYCFHNIQYASAV